MLTQIVPVITTIKKGKQLTLGYDLKNAINDRWPIMRPLELHVNGIKSLQETNPGVAQV